MSHDISLYPCSLRMLRSQSIICGHFLLKPLLLRTDNIRLNLFQFLFSQFLQVGNSILLENILKYPAYTSLVDDIREILKYFLYPQNISLSSQSDNKGV